MLFTVSGRSRCSARPRNQLLLHVVANPPQRDAARLTEVTNRQRVLRCHQPGERWVGITPGSLGWATPIGSIQPNALLCGNGLPLSKEARGRTHKLVRRFIHNIKAKGAAVPCRRRRQGSAVDTAELPAKC